MSIEQLRSNLADHAKDIKLNLSVIFLPENMPDLTIKQIHLVALACAFATKNSNVIEAILTDASDHLSPVEINAAKSAATIMAMNNVYYRFVHLVSDKTYESMPAKLRMNVIGNPGIEKSDFELICLAVSAINGCGMCMDAHVAQLKKANVSKESIQSAVRIAAVINAAAIGNEI